MSSSKIKYQNLKENKNEKRQESVLADAREIRHDATGVDRMEKLFRQDWEVFLLNNLLMSVQFFENYERDVHLLRESWFKETSLGSHHKKCFFADTLFRLAGANVNFGAHENSKTSLCPLRIYISSDNMEAVFDPSSLGHNKSSVWPQYQFTVKTDEKKMKSGCVYLVEPRRTRTLKESSTDSPASRASVAANEQSKQQQQNHVYTQRKSISDQKNARRLTKTEKLIAYQNKELNSSLMERRSSLKHVMEGTDAVIPFDAFYRFANAKERVKPTKIREYRMNSALLSSCEIPLMCFQRRDIKQTLNPGRRTGIMKNGLNPVFRSQNVLNSAAFKGYFCDLLIERLAEALALDFAALNNSSVLEEFIMVNQPGMQYGIAPVINIRDWNNFIVINQREEEMKGLQWPSSYMHRIMNILPCTAVPRGQSAVSEKNHDYEKEWTLVFPKAEEFLLLHMMHSHVRCYFFALLLYKTFLETEINVGSFGPKHLLHLLFWRVQKNFLAWPEDRPGETLLVYLKALYKKLQNKHLRDFFVTSRNLFAPSLPQDLHKAQTLIKKIIENPVPCIMRAIRNLQFKSTFYPPLDALKLHNILTAKSPPEKSKPVKKEKRGKVVHFENDDEERQWKKNAIKQIELERKADEDASKPAVKSISSDEILNLDAAKDHDKCLQILQIFLSHFLKMRNKSVEFKFSSQALSYLSQAQKLLDLMVAKGGSSNDTQVLCEKLDKLKENVFTAKQDSLGLTRTGQPKEASVCKPTHTSQSDVEGQAREESREIKFTINIEKETQMDEGNESSNENEGYVSKL